MKYNDWKLTVLSNANGANVHNLYSALTVIGIALETDMSNRKDIIEMSVKRINELTNGCFSVSSIDEFCELFK